jgi:hypothetical protein
MRIGAAGLGGTSVLSDFRLCVARGRLVVTEGRRGEVNESRVLDVAGGGYDEVARRVGRRVELRVRLLPKVETVSAVPSMGRPKGCPGK